MSLKYKYTVIGYCRVTRAGIHADLAAIDTGLVAEVRRTVAIDQNAEDPEVLLVLKSVIPLGTIRASPKQSSPSLTGGPTLMWNSVNRVMPGLPPWRRGWVADRAWFGSLPIHQWVTITGHCVQLRLIRPNGG